MSGQRRYSWGALGSMWGMGRAGDTNRVMVVAGREWQGWYGEGSGSGTKRVVAVAWRRQHT